MHGSEKVLRSVSGLFLELHKKSEDGKARLFAMIYHSDNLFTCLIQMTMTQACWYLGKKQRLSA